MAKKSVYKLYPTVEQESLLSKKIEASRNTEGEQIEVTTFNLSEELPTIQEELTSIKEIHIEASVDAIENLNNQIPQILTSENGRQYSIKGGMGPNGYSLFLTDIETGQTVQIKKKPV